MSTKIVMLGGRRAGKSSILASVLKCMNDELSSIGVNVQEDKSGSMTSVTKTLNDKVAELKFYIEEQDDKVQFVVDSNPSIGSSNYRLKIGKTGDQITKTFEFIDVPGEWMQPNSEGGSEIREEDGVPNYKWLISQVKEGDVFIVAIDTPYLFERSSINDFYNKNNEIDDILQNIIIRDEGENIGDDDENIIGNGKMIDKKMIVFCPVKAEKYFNEGIIDQVTEKVKQTYKNTINRWVNRGVEILIMPLKTAGGLEFVKMRTPVKYYANDKQQVCTVCGIDVYANINDSKTKLYAEDGYVIRQTSESLIELPQNEQDQFLGKWMFDKYIIPKAWYRCNGEGYAPEYCEQPALRILKFLLEKDVCVKDVQQRIQTEYGLFDRLRDIASAIAGVVRAVLGIKPTFSTAEYGVFNDILNKVGNSGKLKSYPGYLEITEAIKDDKNN